MTSSQDIPLRCEQSTYAGVNPGQHWRGKRAMYSKEKTRPEKGCQIRFYPETWKKIGFLRHYCPLF